MALLHHRLPRFWLALTLGSLLVAVGGLYWWERQLPGRLQQAQARGDLDACLRFSEQMAALSWLPGGTPLQQGRCRRDKATQLWQRRAWAEALQMQRQLVASSAATPADRQRLETWQQELRTEAINRFQAGDLEAALAALKPLGEAGGSGGRALGDELRDLWNRSRLQLQRAERLSGEARWWEALDALNRIEHPWWQQRGQAVRRRVETALSKLRSGDRERDSHGSLPHTVPEAQLDALVQKRIATGMNEWQAFEAACRELGGKVVEAGPESACQR